MSSLQLGFARLADELGLRVVPARVNGQPGAVVVHADGAPYSVLSLDVAGGEVTTVRSIVNPGKLRHLDRRPRS